LLKQSEEEITNNSFQLKLCKKTKRIELIDIHFIDIQELEQDYTNLANTVTFVDPSLLELKEKPVVAGSYRPFLSFLVPLFHRKFFYKTRGTV